MANCAERSRPGQPVHPCSGRAGGAAVRPRTVDRHEAACVAHLGGSVHGGDPGVLVGAQVLQVIQERVADEHELRLHLKHRLAQIVHLVVL